MSLPRFGGDLCETVPPNLARSAALTVTDRLGQDCRDVLDALGINATSVTCVPQPQRLREPQERIHSRSVRIRGTRVGA